MLIKNALVYGEDFRFHPGYIRTEGGKIKETGSESDLQTLFSEKEEEVLDAQGNYAVPGLIDLHFHGCMNADFCDGTPEAMQTLAEYELRSGVTAICPAALTLPASELIRTLETAAEYAKRQQAGECAPGADLIGINMEGPFISYEKKGAQNGNYIIPADVKLCEEFIHASGGLLKIIGLAPEANPGFERYIEAVRDKVHVSLAHTNADYDTAMAAFSAGACHAVHLYNAMPAYSHRAPGVVGAVFDSPHVTAELICDGNHVHPAVARAAFRTLGDDRIVLISDSLRAAGLGDGPMLLGGQEVIVEGTRATLVHGGNLAGSVTSLSGCLRIAVTQMGIPLESAVRAASSNPARVLGVSKDYGSLAEGKKADIVLLDKNCSVVTVIKDGNQVRS